MKASAGSLKPLDDQGTRADRPTEEVKWSRLYNCRFDRGRIRQRPGLKLLNSEIPNEPAPVMLITQRNHVREDLLTEILTPNADAGGTGWLSTDPGDVYYTEIDESPANDNDYMYTSTEGARGGVGFSDLQKTYTEIRLVTLIARACNQDFSHSTTYARINAYEYTSAYKLGDTQLLYSETSDLIYEYMSWPMPTQPSTGRVWDAAGVSLFRADFEFVEMWLEDYEYGRPVADGSDSDWVKPADPQTDKYKEVDEIACSNDGDATRVETGTRGACISVISPSTYDSTFLEVYHASLMVALKQLPSDARYRLYYVDGTEKKLWGAPFWIPGATGGAYICVVISLDKDPSTGEAWVASDLDDMEVGVELLEIGVGETAKLSAINLRADGYRLRSPPQGVRLSQAYVQIDGYYTDEIPYAHLFITNRDFCRSSALDGGDPISSVIGAVADPTVPSAHHWDSALFEGTVYVCNGQDQLARYPSATEVFEVIPSGPHPTGRTIEAYADRIILGDVTESGQRVPDQLRWCKYRDTTNWSHATAGDLRLRQTPGAVVKVKNLLQFMVAYKEVGIYNCIHRADPNSPILATVQDPETGCLSKATVQAIGGQAAAEHAFLGQDLNGPNVFKYNGDFATPIGQGIVDDLRGNHSKTQLSHAFAVTDPDTDLYLLFVPEGGQIFPRQCYVWSDRLQLWTGQWHFPFDITAAGIWYVSRGSYYSGEHERQNTVILGTNTGQVLMLDYAKQSDPATLGAGEGLTAQAILQEIETGDLALDFSTRVKTYDVWASYIDHGVVQMDATTSQDGGKSYRDVYTHFLGTTLGDEELRIASRNVGLDTSRRVRIKLSNDRVDQELDLADIGIEAAGTTVRRP